MQAAYLLTQDGNLTIVLPESGKTFAVGTSHPNHASILEMLKSDNHNGLEALIDIPATITNAMGETGVSVRDGQVFFNETPVHNTVCERILGFIREGLPYMPLVKFLENLMKNPSSRSVGELYDFLEHRGFPITEDGCFIGYKGIRSDWMDKYSGTISNAIGQKPTFPRNQVDDNRENECSWGLHVGTLEYAQGYIDGNGRLVLVKVNPADCVSVPKDHDASKLRVASYEVIAEAQGRIDTPMYPMPSEEVDEDFDEDEDEGFEIEIDMDEDEGDIAGDPADAEGQPMPTAGAVGGKIVGVFVPRRQPCEWCEAKGGKKHKWGCGRPRK
jgi:hypothetical protein